MSDRAFEALVIGLIVLYRHGRLDYKEAAEALNFSESTLRQHVNKKRINVERDGDRVYFTVPEIAEKILNGVAS